MEENQQEASMPLVPIDSFSYSWLVNFPSTEASIDDYHQNYEDSSSSSFIEMDPRLPPSRRFFINKAHESSFKFDNFVSFSEEDHSLVHADELIRDGYVVPYISKATTAGREEEYKSLDTKKEKKIETRDIKNKSPSRKLSVSKWVLFKYLDFFTPLCKRLRRCRSARSPGDIGSDTRIRVTTLSRSRVYSDETTSSPRISVADDYYWRRSCDSESSIYEAVLHCKKSFEK
ncbi:putative membrane-associated kinase regulator 6 [Raphanus sativus]|uniref:Probable membrane-associated kinase regulator 6 n=1 Tax=Raphanus sativus TaxID=3726 RepID=A0A6J0M5V2_RAPSA|nr:probable membrane-associated kinase regulator 6 [Raphanus sativus]KAJ4875738.1 putative membrane-associated kinase regulator 6 [Raphanus sativus]